MPTPGSVRSRKPAYSPAPLSERQANNIPLIIAGVLILLAIGGGFLVFTGYTLTDPGGGGAGNNQPQATVAEVGAAPTLVAPSVPATAAPTSAIVPINDDTGTFAINLRGDLQIETDPTEAAGGFVVPRITASTNLEQYYADNTTYGIFVVVVGPDIGSEVTQVLAFLEPDGSVCTGRVKDAINTSLGVATRITLSGCGIDETGVKVILSIQLADKPLVIGMRMQDTGEVTAVQSAVLYILETMQVF